MSDFKIGDNIIHKSYSKINWVIERIDGDEVYCSTIVEKTLEQKKEVFALTSIEKYPEPKIHFVKKIRRNYY